MSAQHLRQLGNAMFSKGYLSSALDKYAEAVEADPTDPRAYNNMALCHKKLAVSMEEVDPDTSAEHWNRASELAEEAARRANALLQTARAAAGGAAGDHTHLRGQLAKALYYRGMSKCRCGESAEGQRLLEAAASEARGLGDGASGLVRDCTEELWRQRRRHAEERGTAAAGAGPGGAGGGGASAFRNGSGGTSAPPDAAGFETTGADAAALAAALAASDIAADVLRHELGWNAERYANALGTVLEGARGRAHATSPAAAPEAAAAAAAGARPVEAPSWALCPITMDVFRDPVTAPSGNTFDRSAILAHLARSQTDPISREPLLASQLVPNLALRHAIDEWMRANPLANV
ncbi:hypothetical protein FNF29_01448 [Cafeteria roenbergensis]|uniref:E3 ubiquitin-protein ligase CHIP n=1 Tax=Cafeteria roenbergensis TaxID=33653 RepID=A0A5A8CV38_CAFRO|nr:hypothetical protein FNF29_01448 [Cafeteria roenbergensis]|eukprot:KAA0156030.1 hypothetical protein FNF29_01448 [Cafeteria roenbergensis]